MFEDFGNGNGVFPLVPSNQISYTYCGGANIFPTDGYYAVTNNTGNLSANLQAYYGWLVMTDHTSSNGLGKMLIVNADANKAGVFYQKDIVGLCSYAKYEFSAWIANLCSPQACPGASPVNVTFEIIDKSNNQVLGSIVTGNIPSNNGTANWNRFAFMLPSTGSGQIKVVLKNNGLGGCGNDLAIDDICFAPCGSLSNLAIVPPPCGGGAYSISISGVTFTNPFYQWQKSIDNGVTWTDVGAPTQSTTLNQNQTNTTNAPITILYRAIFATNSSDLGAGSACKYFSDPISIIIPPFLNTTIAGTNAGCTTGLGSASVTISSGTPGYTYTWSNGQTTSVISGLSAGNYFVTITDSKGCTNSQSVTITGAIPVFVSTTFSPVCGVNNGSISSTVTGGTGLFNYLWSPSGQTTSSATGLSAGIHTVTVTDGGGCVTTATQNVVPNPAPIPNFTATPVCLNTNPMQFNDLSIGNTSITNWNWNFGDNNTSTLQNPSHNYLSEGSYTVTLSVTNSFGCIDSIKALVNVYPTPEANFSSITQCFGDTTCFTNLSTISSGTITNWVWDFGSSNTSTVQNPCFKFTGAGPNPVTLTATSSNGCVNTKTINITSPLPIIISTSFVPVCGNNNGSISASATGGTGVLTYLWNPSGQTSSTATGLAVGNYTVTVTDSKGCNSIASQSIISSPSPIANFTSTPVCLNTTPTLFQDLSIGNTTVTNWDWNFGDNNSSTQQNPSHSYANDGTYTVTLIATNIYGCKDTISLTTIVNPLPIPNFSSIPVCFGDTTCFSNLSTISSGNIVSWAWDFGSSNTSIQKNPCYKFTGIGPNNVSLTAVSNLGCQNIITLPISLNPLPTANIIPQNVCLNFTTNLKDGSTSGSGDPIVSWNWGFGDGNFSNQQNAIHTYSVAGTYTISLNIATQNGCKDTTTNFVTVHDKPIANFTSTPVCLNSNPTLFNDLSIGNTTVTNWDWNFGDNTTSSLQNPSHNYGNSGTYNVTLIVTNSFGCKDTLFLNTIVNPLPITNFSSKPVCYGDVTCFNDLSTISSGNITTLAWDFGSSNTSNLKNPCFKFSGTGSHTATLTATSNYGCQNTIVLPIILNPLPIASINSQNVCLNTATNFIDGSTSATGDLINTWVWSFGDGTNTNQQNPIHTYSVSGTYSISLIVTSQNGCKDTTMNIITVFNKPVANFSGSGEGCIPLCVTNYKDLSIIPPSNTATWLWSFPGGVPSSSNSQNPPQICYNTLGSFGASLIVTTNYGCKDSITLKNLANTSPIPQAEFSIANNPVSIFDPIISISNQSSNDAVKWSWNFGDYSPIDTISFNPQHSYSMTVVNNDLYTFPICLTVKNLHGCWDTTCHTVQVIPEFEFYIPNSYTPNGDNINDFFYAKCQGVKQYQILIFDRWGAQIWECHNEGKNTAWDGNINNSTQEGMSSFCKWDGKVQTSGITINTQSNEVVKQDVYIWKVHLTDIFNKKHSYIGHVSVIK